MTTAGKMGTPLKSHFPYQWLTVKSHNDENGDADNLQTQEPSSPAVENLAYLLSKTI